MSYYSDVETERRLQRLEAKIAKEYTAAAAEMKDKADEYFAKLTKRYQEQYSAYLDGKYTKAEFDAWYKTQVERGEGYRKMVDKLCSRAVDANVVAAALINDTTPGIWALNYNYEAYRINGAYGIDFQLFDEMTIKQLLMEDNHITFKHRWVNVDPDKSYAWNEKQINNALTAGILQGKSIDDLADSYMTVMGRNKSAAIRNARTSVTSAQNSGRMESFSRAEDMGIELEKEWMATLDSRTRDSHRDLDGEHQKNKDEFSNGLMYPGDPSGDPAEVYNCRCTMTAILPKFGSGNNTARTYKGSEGYREYDENGKAKTISGYTYKGKNNTKSYLDWLKSNLKSTTGDANISARIKSDILKKLESGTIAYKKVEKYDTIPSKGDIINKLYGGDMTKGSCASLCMAYMGNISGYDVTDFRGGDSQSFFSRAGHIYDIFNLSGKMTLVEDYNEIKVGVQLLKSMEEGKEYCMTIGRHASMVRVNNGVFEYLELQSSTNSGWTPFNGNPRYTLKNRFGCRQSITSYGIKLKTKSVLIEADAMTGIEDFGDILGYINTDADKQLKGVFGSVK